MTTSGTATTHAVGIEFGTANASIAYLNERGEPITLTNREGESSTPCWVMFDDEEAIAGAQAFRASRSEPNRVYRSWLLGDPYDARLVDDQHAPIDIATAILRHIVEPAREQIGRFDEAVIAVPAHFNAVQREAVVEAARRVELQSTTIIDQPIAACLCHILGSEGIWFAELAEEQRVLVYHLDRGSFDVSLVHYHKDSLTVQALDGDFMLGGLDWERRLAGFLAKQFVNEFREDPRAKSDDREFLFDGCRQLINSLSVRPKAAVLCRAGGHQKQYQFDTTQLDQITRPLVQRTEEITKRLIVNGLGIPKYGSHAWARIDVALTTGESTRMPMIRRMLKSLSGTTLNTSLSPDQSICHGAAYIAGKILSDMQFLRSIQSHTPAQRLAVENESLTEAATDSAARLNRLRNRPNGDDQAPAPPPWFRSTKNRHAADKRRESNSTNPQRETGIKQNGVVAGYRLAGVLGRGGMGIVYRAVRECDQAVVALKTLPLKFASHSTAIERFLRELRLGTDLNHENIVRTLETGQAGQTIYQIMELVEGLNLHQHVEKHGPLESDVAADLFRQMASGLSHAHRCGIIHRDVKPSNVMLSNEGKVKILDLGLARDGEDEILQLSPHSKSITLTGNLLGTPPFMAPEQIKDSRRADERSDVYSLGCTMFFLLTAKYAFHGDNLWTILSRHYEGNAESLRALRPDLPADFVDLIDRMIERRPEDRFQSMDDVLNEPGLKRILNSS